MMFQPLLRSQSGLAVVVIFFYNEKSQHGQKTEIQKNREPLLEIDGMDRRSTEGETCLQQLNGQKGRHRACAG
jgi:hypothetical protein